MKKKIIISAVVALVIILAGGSAFVYTRMTGTKGEKEASPAKTPPDAEKQAEAQKALNDEDISGSDSAGKKAENPETGENKADESKKKAQKTERRAKGRNEALKNLEKERRSTLEFLEQYDQEAIRKKKRSEAISRWLEKKPN